MYTDGIVINMVVGGEVVALKNIEENSGFLIAEMPINVSFSVWTQPFNSLSYTLK